MKGNTRIFVILASIALVVAMLRYFMKGWLQPLGVSDVAGSFVASVTLVLLVGLVVFFAHEGRAAQGSYWTAAGWFAAFAVWCQCLVIAGILTTSQTGAATYYEEGMGKHVTLPPVQHALSHGIAAVAAAIVGMILGAPIYFLTKRGRSANPSLVR